MPTLAEVQASNASLRALLNSATKKMAENGRLMEFDLAVATQRLNDGEALEAAMLGGRPQVRRLLMIQYGKGL